MTSTGPDPAPLADLQAELKAQVERRCRETIAEQARLALVCEVQGHEVTFRPSWWEDQPTRCSRCQVIV